MFSRIFFFLMNEEVKEKKKWYILDLCVSSLRRGHANLLCIVPIFTDDPEGFQELNVKIYIYNNTTDYRFKFGFFFSPKGPGIITFEKTNVDNFAAEIKIQACWWRLCTWTLCVSVRWATVQVIWIKKIFIHEIVLLFSEVYNIILSTCSNWHSSFCYQKISWTVVKSIF